VFIFWNQGWENAPFLCKMCVKSWKKYNWNTHQIIELDNKTISHYIHDKRIVQTINDIGNFKCWTQASDLLRINLVAIHGGFWVDATMLCTKPINEYKHMIENKYNFWFPFDYDSYIHSYNFIYSTANNSIIQNVANSMNKHFYEMKKYENPVDTYEPIFHLYIGRLMYDRLKTLINWDVIKACQLTASSNNRKIGYKMFQTKNILSRKITNDLINEINKQHFLKLTTRHGVKYTQQFEKGTVLDYLFKKYT
tara:strand:+ start:665 stop:1420 length:756 start_codon:yes stop_codon:yes gene_type:complete